MERVLLSRENICQVDWEKRGPEKNEQTGKSNHIGRTLSESRCYAVRCEKKQSKMKTLGIIGGVGPESTMDYYRSIIALYRERKGDGTYPQFIINSIDLKKELDLLTASDLTGMTQFLLDEIRKLAGAGADFGLIASNTPHLVFDDLQRQSPIPLISIVESTCAAAKAMKLSRPALFGARFTMQARFYLNVFSPHGIKIVVPEAKDQDYIHDKYMNELVNGIFRPETRDGLLAIVDRMKEKEKIDGVILGGTELPLILRESGHNGLPFLNTTKIHVEAAVAEMLK
jgi:aspartate racemase